ncbi:MAG: TonB-dependent receptor [Gemmatimonadales bacterium]
MRWTSIARRVVAGVMSLYWLSSGALGAQAPTGTVVGRVVEAGSGRAVVGASIRALATGRSVESDAEGRYRLTGVPAGTQEIAIRAIGWGATRVTVRVTAGAEVTRDVVLEAEPVSLDDLVVSVSREAQTRSETAASIGVVDEEALRRARPHHPADVVQQVAGAWVANLSGEGHFTAIRQPITTKPVYAYLEDGVPIRSTGFFNHNALYEINIPQAARIEVIKGPGSALYGSDAIGGVVSSFTRAPTAGAGGELFLEGGRFGYLRALGSASNTWGRNGLRADLNLTHSDSYRDQAPYSRQSGTVRWDHAVGPTTSLKTVVALSHIDQPGDGGGEVTQADFDTDPTKNSTPVAFRRVFALRASSTLERQEGLSLFAATLYGRRNELDLLPSWQLSFDPQVWESRNSSLGLLTRFRRTIPALNANLSVGLDLEVSPGSRLEQQIVPTQDAGRYVSYTTGEVQYDYDVTFWQASPYAQLNATVADRLHLDFGLRLDNVGFSYETALAPVQTGAHRVPGSTSVDYRRLTPKLGATLDLSSSLNAFVSYRAAFRAPSESQLFRQGQAVSTVDLAPVKADNYEAGLRGNVAGRVGFDVTLYQLDITDDILTFLDPANGLRTATNAGATRHRGVELGLSVRPTTAFRVDGSWAYTDQEYREWRPSTTVDYSGQTIELAPSNMGRIGATWTPALLRSGYLSAEWVHMGHYWMNPDNTERYDGYDLFNLSAAVPVVTGLQLVGRLQNAGNARYAESTSYNAFQGRRYRPGQPRTLYLGAQYFLGAARLD